ncbi:MAG: hypothetical protein V7K95_13170 [Nostoc sp.]
MKISVDSSLCVAPVASSRGTRRQVLQVGGATHWLPNALASLRLCGSIKK